MPIILRYFLIQLVFSVRIKSISNHSVIIKVRCFATHSFIILFAVNERVTERRQYVRNNWSNERKPNQTELEQNLLSCL